MTEEQKFDIGRSSAMQMGLQTSNIIWSSFNTILLVNVASVTVSGLVGTPAALRPQLSPWTASILAIAGLAVCFVWFCTVMRHFKYLDYYFACTKFYEDKLLNQSGFIKVVELGSTYGNGGKVLVGNSTMKMPWLLGVLKIQVAVIAIFALLYILLLAFSIFHGITSPAIDCD